MGTRVSLPEGVVEKHIEGDEAADHGGLLEQKEEVELLVRCVMVFHEASTPKGARKPVSTTSHMEVPSTPR